MGYVTLCPILYNYPPETMGFEKNDPTKIRGSFFYVVFLNLRRWDYLKCGLAS